MFLNSCNNNNEISNKNDNKNDTSKDTTKTIIRDPDNRKDYVNVFWKRKYTLFDLITDEPIFPVIENGVKVYKIYYSSNEDPNPHQGSFTEGQLENHLYYKFKDKSTCLEFCNSKKQQSKTNTDKKVKIIRDPDSRKDYVNVFWKRKYTLFDLITDEPIFPVIENGVKVYKIYYSSNEDPNSHQGSFTEEQLENHLYYKFKDRSTCLEFCNSKKKQSKTNTEKKVKIIRDPDSRKDYVNVFWKRKYTLFDLITDEPIFPVIENGVKVYKIYYSSNEDPNPHQGSFTEEQLENHSYYKFKDKSTCSKFCRSKN
jgi:acid phosphatase class B